MIKRSLVSVDNSHWFAWSALACILLTATLYYGPYLIRTDLFSDDVAHHVFWSYRYADPELFPADLSVPYFLTSAPWGYRALYAVLAPWVDPLEASKWISVLLFLAAGALIWAIGSRQSATDGERFALFVVLALCLLLDWSRGLLPPNAFQRSFALTLLLFTLWALVTRRYAFVGISWLAAALFYPVVLPVQGLTAGAVFLRNLAATRQMP